MLRQISTLYFAITLASALPQNTLLGGLSTNFAALFPIQMPSILQPATISSTGGQGTYGRVVSSVAQQSEYGYNGLLSPGVTAVQQPSVVVASQPRVKTYLTPVKTVQRVYSPAVFTQPMTVVSQPVATQHVLTQPVVSQPAVTHQIVTQPAVTHQIVTQPVVTQPVVHQYIAQPQQTYQQTYQLTQPQIISQPIYSQPSSVVGVLPQGSCTQGYDCQTVSNANYGVGYPMMQSARLTQEKKNTKREAPSTPYPEFRDETTMPRHIKSDREHSELDITF